MVYRVEIEDSPGGETDDGTMPQNAAKLAMQVVGQRIVKVEMNVELPDVNDGRYHWTTKGTAITLEGGRRVFLVDTDDCCARTELKAFLLNHELVDHIIMGVGTSDGFNTWHIFADMGDVLKLTVNWTCGNAFYYSYGFKIKVFDPEPEVELAE